MIVLYWFEVTQETGYSHIAVISTVGTQENYGRHGFEVDGLYMTVALDID